MTIRNIVSVSRAPPCWWPSSWQPSYIAIHYHRLLQLMATPHKARDSE